MSSTTVMNETESAVQRSTDKIMELIERESEKRVDWLKRENEMQRRQINLLAQDLIRVAEDGQRAKLEAQRCKAEVERYKSNVDLSAEVGRLSAAVQLWKNKYKLAARRRDEAQRRLEKTQARFSHTLIPVEDNELSTGTEGHASAPGTPTKSSPLPSSDNGSSDASPMTDRKKNSTSLPTSSGAGAAVDKSLPSAGTSKTSNVEHPIATPPSSKDSNDIAMLFNSKSTPPNKFSTNLQLDSASSPSRPPQTPDSKRRWCYCNFYEYGAMIMCGNKTCTKQWFHVPCTGLDKMPEGDWLCRLCAPPGGIAPKPSSNTQNQDASRP